MIRSWVCKVFGHKQPRQNWMNDTWVIDRVVQIPCSRCRMIYWTTK